MTFFACPAPLFMTQTLAGASRRGVFWILVSALVLAMTTGAGAAQALQSNSLADDSSSSCRTMTFSEPLYWLSSAAWLESKRSLILVDPLRGSWFLVDLKGKVSELEDPRVGEERGTPLQPAAIASAGDGFVLRTFSAGDLWFGPDLVRQSSSRLLRDTGLGKAAPQITSLYSGWKISSSGERVFGYGTYSHPDEAAQLLAATGSWNRKGLVVADLDPVSRTLMKAELLLERPHYQYYLLGLEVLAESDGIVYFLSFTASDELPGEAAIFAMPVEGSRPERLDILPESLREIPPLEVKSLGPSTTQALFARLKELSLPVGLFPGENGNIHLLTRKPGRLGTVWELLELDPSTGEQGSRKTLPTLSAHITLVRLGDSSWEWAVIERGDVIAEGQHQIIEKAHLLPRGSMSGNAPAIMRCRPTGGG